ncbi:acyl-CoA carboxylase subunit epsilon [Pseudonocardia sp. HH130630-07]|uniref:acyl-CoA carboxylase subunit epsilon n=1 Tax=Pseudonocardia sp. HH130630-07 TaxID=1690815 RepID=UPI00081520DC|nr:acyl-CoA carboxylase subunit epsilon [Pseudonocardia sp. HH130630-07]ANY07544.1 acetyl-CoA carboxylase biotin carboxyl carrier protein subunit [Pseudonocardia sp. HH130630-07]
MSGDDEPTPEERRALFRVVRGTPDDRELAALTAVLAAAASGTGTGSAPAAAPSPWSHPAAQLRAPLAPGPGAWRASALPR